MKRALGKKRCCSHGPVEICPTQRTRRPGKNEQSSGTCTVRSPFLAHSLSPIALD